MEELFNNYNIIRYLSIVYVYHKYKSQQKRSKRKSIWVREIFKKRKMQGDFYNLVQEMRLNDSWKHFNYFRMSVEEFELLLSFVGPLITKKHFIRESISAAERLSVTLRYLASGDSMISMSYAYRLGKTTVSNIINETCSAIWEALHDKVFLIPTESNWLEVANGFSNSWQLPHCIGAVDGKHVIIQAPPNEASHFYNYKNNHSMILMAICDHRYRFTLIDIGAKGRQSDGGIFRYSEMGRRLFNNSLNVPSIACIPGSQIYMPYYLAADDAFPLCTNIMKPYPGRFLPKEKRIFNYRLSRGRRVIENSFGILVSRWRIFRKPIIASLNTTEKIIQATVCLHNFLINKETNKTTKQYCPDNYVDHEDHNGNLLSGLHHEEGQQLNLLPARSLGSNNSSRMCIQARDNLATYFMGDGAIQFQWQK